MSYYTKINLRDVEDSALKFGHGETHEARFPSKPLGLQKSGASLQRLLPGKRSPFGHSHKVQEELLIVLDGTGRIKLDDSIEELEPMDAVRIAPGVVFALEAGDKGLEFLVFGAPYLEERDWEMVGGKIRVGLIELDGIGTLAEWLRRGLQNLLHRFNSGRCLQITLQQSFCSYI